MEAHKKGYLQSHSNVEISESRKSSGLRDFRFRQLIGEEAWSQLPSAVQLRFSKCKAPGELALYSGEVTFTKLNFAGLILSRLVWLIGRPLPDRNGATGPAVVIVVEEPALGGQSWTRSYARSGLPPHVIHSVKRFGGPTGLEEYVGFGVGMTLRVCVEDRALVFRSDRYFLEGFGLRLYLPRFFEPGRMEIRHEDVGGGAFMFRLGLVHRLFGQMLVQDARFIDID